MKSATRKFFLTVLAALLAIVMTAGLVACTDGEGPNNQESITYTVSVTAEDDILTGVKVQVKSGETVKGESTLTEGKAEFTLAKGTYTATLTGLPTGYTFTAATLTAESPSATIAVTKEGETPPPDDDTITYTVTVTCVDDVLSGVKVQLLEDTTIVGEEDLVNGKAEFTLEEGTYTVSLTGLPAGYTFTEATVTPDQPNATVTVSGTPIEDYISYSVTLSYAAATDVYGTAHTAGPAAGVSVSLYASATDVKPAATVLTDETGKAAFSLPGKSYTVSVASPSYKIQTGADLNLTDSASALTLTLEAKGVLGTEEAPIPFVLGENEVPVSEEILTQYEEVYYVFVPTASGTYYFTTSNNSALLASEVFPDGSIVGKVTELPIELEAGVPYVFRANSTGGKVTEPPTKLETGVPYVSSASSTEEELEFAYTVTISDKGAPEDTSDPNPDARWDGSGVKEDPYIVTNLVGDYSVVVAWRTNKFRYIYFTYTAEEDGHYLASHVSGDGVVLFNNGKFIHKKAMGALNDDTKTDFEVKAGATLTFRVENYDEDASETFTAAFKIEAYVKPAPALGSKENPKEIETIVGEHTGVRVDPTYYYKFTEEEGGFYTVTTTYAQGVYLTLRDGESDAKITSLEIPAGGSSSFTLEAGKTYILGVSSNSSGEYGGAETVNFTVTKADPSAQPDGTEAKPYPLEKFFGDHTISTDYTNGVWYSYELEADTKIYVTAKTTLILHINGTKWQCTNIKQPEKTFDLKAGTVKMHVQYFGGESGEVQFNIAKMGSKDHPDTFSSLVGTHTVRTGATTSASYYISYTETANTDYTFTVKGVGKIYVSGGNYNAKSLVNTNTAVEEVSADFTFEAKKTYTFRFECYMVNEGDVVFTVAKKGEAAVPTTTYTVTVSATASDIFEQSLEAVPAADVAVSLYLGTDRVLTAYTDGEGVAKFEVAENSGYTVKVEGSDTAYSFTDKAVSVNVSSDAVYGTEAHPLTLQTGTTDIPFTYDLLSKLHEADEDFLGAYYTFTPAKSGNYVFTVSEEWGYLMVIDGDKTKLTVGGPSILSEEGISGSVELEEGKTYTVVIGSLNEGFAVTVGLEGAAKWEGSGTETDPYVITTLIDTYTVSVSYEDGAYTEVYFTYTAKEAGSYKISSESEGNYCVTAKTASINSTKKSDTFSLAVGDELTISVKGYDDEVTDSFTVTFKIETYVKPNGLNNPEVLETLVGEHTVTLNPDGTTWYFSYTTTKDADYNISTDYEDGVTWGVRSSQWGNVKSSDAEPGKPANFSLVSGKTYYFSIMAKNKAVGVTLTFTIAEGKVDVGGGEGGGDDTPADGTEAHPYVIDEIVGKHTFHETSSGHYYTFTVKEAGTYTFTALTSIYLSGDGISLSGAAGKSIEKDLEAKAYTVRIMVYGGATEGEVSFSVAKKAEEEQKPAESGTKENPEVLTSLPETLTRSVYFNNDYYISYTPTKDEAYTITNRYTKSVTLLMTGGNNQLVVKDGSINVSLKANTAFVLGIRFQSSQTPVEVTLAFSVFTVPEIPWTEGSGTEEDPYVITSLEGDFNVLVSSPVWFKFVATEDGAFTFTPTTQCAITLKSAHVWTSNDSKAYSVNNPATATRKQDGIELKSGETLLFNVANSMNQGSNLNIVSFTVTKGAPVVETALDGEYALPVEKH